MNSDQKGRLGESRTEALLLGRFLVLKRSTDSDGADFLIEKTHTSPISRYTPVRVQAKFRSFGVAIEIPASYVRNGGLPRSDFFLIVHTNEDDDSAQRWFFSAAEILAIGKESDDGTKFSFRLTDSGSFHEQQIASDEIYERLGTAIDHASFSDLLLQQCTWPGTPSADLIVRRLTGIKSLSDAASLFASRLRWSDIPLIERIQPLVFWIRNFAFVAPFSTYEFALEGPECYLQFDASFDLNSVVITPTRKLLAIQTNPNRLSFEAGPIQKLQIRDSNGSNHSFPMSEGFGRRCHCVLHPNCHCDLINGTVSIAWRRATKTWCSHQRFAAIDPIWSRGFLGHMMTVSELLSLEESRVLRSLATVPLPVSDLGDFQIVSAKQAIDFHAVDRLPGSMQVDVLELGDGAAEIIASMTRSSPNPIYEELIERLVIWAHI